MKKTRFLGILLLVLPLAAQTNQKAWNFDRDKLGTVPREFTRETGDWETVVDPSAPSAPNVLAQLAKRSGQTFNLVLNSTVTYKDVDITVRIKAVAGSIDQGGGIVWRAADANNYYLVRYNPLEDNLCLYKVEKGKRIELTCVNIPHRRPAWHVLRVTMSGDQITAYYDNKKVLESKDISFPAGGKIGLWTKADAQSHFDDLKVAGQ